MKVPGVREKSRAKTKPAQAGRRILYLQIAMDYPCLNGSKDERLGLSIQRPLFTL